MPDPTLESVLRSALAHLEVACQVIDERFAGKALDDNELQLMADVVAKTNELVAGYEDQLPQGV